jgi:hypothetical protein
MSTLAKTRMAVVLGVTVALLLAAFAVAPQADAATIYACVKKGTGAARIVSKKSKCKKSESKLSWSTEGPAGRSGANGANGANGKEGSAGKDGANGAVAVYAATRLTTAALSASEVEVLGKSLPAGHYLASAKVLTRAFAAGGGFLAVRCELWDKGTETTLDEAEWAGGLAEFKAGEFGGAATLPLQAAFSTAGSDEIQVWCETTANGASASANAENTQIAAVQTSSIG